MRIVVTGGAGYVGSHTLVDLLAGSHDVMVVDNFANSSPIALDRVRQLSNHKFDQLEADIADESAMRQMMADFRPEAVIHFAGLKAVGESEADPITYYRVNVGGTLSLLRVMESAGCAAIVFSSSATVYGTPHYLPYDETHPLSPVNPYGRTKYFIEQIIRDWTRADARRKGVLLRYFNPVGAHESGLIGEDPLGLPNNLLPFIAQVAVGRRDELSVFGNDYDTPDGTGVRDYIHVADLARGHVAAVDYLERCDGVEAFNLGTGKGVSVLEMIRAFELASGRTIPHRIAGRRPGDLPAYWAAPDLAAKRLNWTARLGLADICRDAWTWQSQNPDGYRG